MHFVAYGGGDGGDHFGVEHERCGFICEFVHHGSNVGGRDGGKFRDAAVDQEAFEAAYACSDEGFELVDVAGDDAAVEADVYPALILCCINLFFEAVKSSCGRDGIEGHVDHRCDASRCGSLCAGVEAFPFCATWLIEVDMSVNESGEQDVGTVILIRCASWKVRRWEDSGGDCGDFSCDCGDGYRGWSELTTDDCSSRGEDGGRMVIWW